jgi:UDP-N-acetylmuramoyl-tripeptide--D-alanyl-D-alanine ligase
MKPISIQQVRAAVGGRALSSIPADIPEIRAVCTDTRRMEPGSLFVALRGEKFNAHSFLPQAAAGGAVAALVESPPPESLPNVCLIQVPDTRVALGKLARAIRRLMLSKVIAVAGSNGKTSTKHLIDAALRPKLRGSISPKSYNNDIGVPLTIFPADPNQDYLVLEMGTNHHGEIKILAEMAEPDIAVITNCSAEHLEGLDDLMGVRQENASIIESLNPRGLLVYNGDDRELRDAVAGYGGKTATFGFNPDNDLFANDVQVGEEGVRFRVNNRPQELFVPMLGRHAAINALAAIAVARGMRVAEEDIFLNLEQAHGAEMRLELQKAGGVTILNDAYNANPASMRAALETLCALPVAERRIAVLGDMRELGKSSARYHTDIGELVGSLRASLAEVICVGPESERIIRSATASGMPDSMLTHFADAAEAARFVPGRLRAGDLVLLKASRGIHLETVAAAIVSSRRAGNVRLAAS